MSAFHDMLRAGQARLEALAGSSFTVDGEVGTFTGILDVTTQLNAYGSSGVEPDDTARLTVKQTISWVPATGDVLTCDGIDWRVTSVKKGKVEYECELIGVDQ